MKRGTTSKGVKEALQTRSVEEGASGKGDLMMRRAPKDAAIKRKAGKSRRVKNLSTKSTKKAAAATFEAKKPAAAGPTAAAEAVNEVEVKNPAAAVPALAAESDTTGKEEKLRLPQKFVEHVLSWKPVYIVDPDEYYARKINDPVFSREYVERSTKTLRDVAEASKRVADMMVDYKAWMRAEYEKKGYVEVDDEYIAQGARQSQELEEDDEYPEAFGPVEGLITDETPQSVIDEIFGRISVSA